MPAIALNEDLDLPLSLDAAWAAVHDLSLWQDSLPAGASVRAGPAPRSAALSISGFDGHLLPLDIDPPGKLRLHIDGPASTLGAVDGQVQLRLERLGEQRTLLHVALVLKVERLPDGFQRRLGHALKQRLAAWATRVRDALALDVPMPGRQPLKPWPQRLVDWYLGWFAGIFNGTLYPPPKRVRKPPPR